jgi:hypothetical protein
MAAFFLKMVQLHPEDDYMVVVKAKAIHLVTTTMKAQAWAQDPVTPERPSNWTYSIFKELKTKVELRKIIRKYSWKR